MRQQDRKILLLLDNFSGHKWDPAKITNITVKLLPPNMTSHIQPCDAGIIRTFKASFKKLQMKRALDRWENNEEKIYWMSLLDGMFMLTKAWSLVKPSTIRNCWRHTRILHHDASATPNIPSISSRPDIDGADQQEIADAQDALTELYTQTHG